jgi:hypothetical protein
MSYVKRMLQLPTSRARQLVELAIIATLAFSLGLAANSNDKPAGALAVSKAQNHPAVAVRSEVALGRVPYEANWQLYDNGWAGGPSPLRGTSGASALVRVPYEAGWELYDAGWAGGPRAVPESQTSK